MKITPQVVFCEDLAEFGKKNATQILIFLLQYMWAENNKNVQGRTESNIEAHRGKYFRLVQVLISISFDLHKNDTDDHFE